MTDVAVIGAGISGLVAARRLQQLGADVTVYEAADHVGGPMRSEREDGWLAEWGPHTILESNDTLRELVDDLGLSSERQVANREAAKRFVVRDGTPKALPMGPQDLLTTDVFSAKAKLALLREPFVPRRDDGVDESLTNFVERRFDDELLTYGFELIVNGIWAGDPNRLSVRHAFPKMFALEREHGSILRGAIAKMRSGDRSTRPSMIAFRTGNGALPRALAAEIGDLRLGTAVRTIRRDRTWSVSGKRFDAVVSTLSAPQLLAIDFDGATPPIDVLSDVAYPRVSIVTLGFRRDQVEHPLDGFGMIAPMVENLDILGSLFTSTLFDGRAPDGHVTIASFVGGLRRPDLAALDDAEKVARVRTALRRTLGAKGEPAFSRVFDHLQAIPQYEVGHGRVFARLDAFEIANPGFYFAGNLRSGISVPDLVERSTLLAERVMREAR